MSKLVLIDGHSILYRAYHAIPSLTSPDGKPTNAVFGFISMLLRTLQELKPDYTVIVFDRPGGTFRNQWYPNYQAQRKTPDDDFIVQIDTTENLLKSMGFCTEGQVGYEADDIIGTLSNKVAEMPNEKIDIVIVTSDRDQLQLVNDHVRLLMPAVSLGVTKLYGEKETVERMGVTPAYIADFKGLAGDPSDNIPGVPGIGPKTAADLINRFGSLEEIYEHLSEVEKSSVREKLENNRDIAFLSKKLATIVLDAPVAIDWSKWTTPDLVRPEIVTSLHELGFESLVKRLTKPISGVAVKQVQPAVQKQPQKNDEQMELF